MSVIGWQADSGGGGVSGWKDYVVSMNLKGLPVGAASVNTMKLLYDAQENSKITGVKNGLNYTVSGYISPDDMRNKGIFPDWENSWGSYHLSVPDDRTEIDYKDLYPKLAQIHVKAVLSRLPPELDPNFVTVSSWNEIYNYANWETSGRISGLTGTHDANAAQAVEIGKELIKRKAADQPWFRWAAFGFSGGAPEDGVWESPYMLEYLRMCAEHPDILCIAVHEYSFDDILWDGGDHHVGRFQRLFRICDKHQIPYPCVQIKEWGTKHDNIPSNLIDQLEPVAALYDKYPQIELAALWTTSVDGKWGDISQQVAKITPDLMKFNLNRANVPPIEPPQNNKKVFGVDLSKYQSHLDWNKMPDVSFCIIRTSDGFGKDFSVDEMYLDHLDNAVANNLITGSYHTLRTGDIRIQARIASGIRDEQDQIPLAVSVEIAGLKLSDVKLFCEEFFSETGLYPIIYTRKSFWENIERDVAIDWFKRCQLWLAAPGVENPLVPIPWTKWTFQQVAFGESGGKYGLDNNIFNGTISEMEAMYKFKAPIRDVVDPPKPPQGNYIDGFDSPVGTEEERRSEKVWPGYWFDANKFGNFYNGAYHTGADLNKNAPRWDSDKLAPIHAAGNGTVIFAGFVAVWGNIIVVKHEDMLKGVIYTRYAHCEKMLVKSGQEVKRGDIIGTIGKQPTASAPYHLHFDISKWNIHNLANNPGDWPGADKQRLFATYQDPKLFISANRPSDLPSGVELYKYFVPLDSTHSDIIILKTSWAGNQRVQIVADKGKYYLTKDNEYERRRIDSSGIWLEKDTSPSPDKYYVINTNDPWLPLSMKVGETHTRTENPVFYFKQNCRPTGESSNWTTSILFANHYNSYTTPGNVVFNDVIELHWLLNGNVEEKYFYAANAGLIHWNGGWGESYAIQRIKRGDQADNKIVFLPCGDN